MRKIRFLSAWIMAFVSAISCNYEDSLESDSCFPVVISFTEETQVKSILPDTMLDQVKSLKIYVYNSSGHLEQVADSDGYDVTVNFNRWMGYNVYALANFPDLPDAPAEESDFISSVYNVPYGSIKDCGIPMCGKVSLDKEDLLAGAATIELTRLITRVSFSIDKSQLKTSDLIITSVKLRQTASAAAPFAEFFVPDGDMIEEEGDRISAGDMLTLNSGGSVWLYCLENCQGVLLPDNEDPWLKVPEKIGDTAGCCTYLEVCARYSGDYEGVEVTSDNVVYRFYLGKDNVKDFTLERNKGVSVRLMVSDTGVFDRDWRVDYGQSLPVVTTALKISPSAPTVQVLHSTDLKAYYSKYVDGVLSSVTDVSTEALWSVEDNDIAALSGQTLTGISKGVTTVIAEYGGEAAACNITVLPPSSELKFSDQPVWFYAYQKHDIHFTYKNLTSDQLHKRYFSAGGCQVLSVTIVDDDEGFVTLRRGELQARTLKYYYQEEGVQAVINLISKEPELEIDGPDRVLHGSDAKYNVIAWYDWPDGSRTTEDVSGKCMWNIDPPSLKGADGRGNFKNVILDPDDGDGNRYSTSTIVKCSFAGTPVQKDLLVYTYAEYVFDVAMIDSTRDAEYYILTLSRHVYDNNGEITEWAADITYDWRLLLVQGEYYGTGTFDYKLEIDSRMDYINLMSAKIQTTFRTEGEYNSEGMPWESEVTLTKEFELSDF